MVQLEQEKFNAIDVFKKLKNQDKFLNIDKEEKLFENSEAKINNVKNQEKEINEKRIIEEKLEKIEKIKKENENER